MEDTTVRLENPDARVPMYARPLPEVRLWLQVIVQAQQYARGDIKTFYNGEHTPTGRSKMRGKMSREAREWINGKGLDALCALLDLDPDAVREATWR